MNPTIAIPLPDGRWVVLTAAEFEAALARAEQMPALAAAPQSVRASEPERMVSSAEAAALTGVASTTLETMAADGRLRSHRFGRALRFLPSEVTADTRRKS